MARGEVPKITWGTSFANTLTFGYPLVDAVAYPEPGPGSEWAEAPSGEVDAWVVRDDEILQGSVGWIPAGDTTDPVATGWDGATGWGAFLKWARAGNVFRFFPDKDNAAFVACVMADGANAQPPTLESDLTRRLAFRIRSTDGTPFTGY